MYTPLSSNMTRSAILALSCVSALGLTACKSTPPAIDDATLSSSVHGRLQSDSAIASEPIQTSVLNGVATLSGSVSNDAARTLAANDAASVHGVKQVINDLAVAPGAGTPTATAQTTPPAPIRTEPVRPNTRPLIQPAPVQRQPEPLPPLAPVQRAAAAPAPQPPAPPPPPAFRNVTIQAGSTLPVQINETLDSATSQPGDRFTGVLRADVMADGVVALPAGTPVIGRVDEVHDAGHFKGSSLLTVSLTAITRHGDRIPISTDPYSREGKGRGANTGEKVGGGAAVGAILGGIFGGGKGAAIGAGAGAGLGAGANAVTRGQQVQIGSESVVRFRLTNAIPLRVPNDADRHDEERRHPMNQ